MEKTYKIGNREFPLDHDKAEAAFADKKVINGRKSMTFNLLPLKYQWAYDLYRVMKANHWEPEDIQMQKAVALQRDHAERALDHHDGHRLLLRRRRHRGG
jgi:ribonucleoside-diphosphate reductase beta chain